MVKIRGEQMPHLHIQIVKFWQRNEDSSTGVQRGAMGMGFRTGKGCTEVANSNNVQDVQNGLDQVPERQQKQQIDWNELFCGMNCLAVSLSISKLTASKSIDEILNQFFAWQNSFRLINLYRHVGVTALFFSIF